MIEEKIKFLEFKDKDGNTVSVVRKREIEDKTGKYKVFVSSSDDQTVEVIDEARFNDQLAKLEEENTKT